MTTKTVALILAGGQSSRLSILSEERAKPAVPFAGKFRIIDFALSNCVNSGIYTVGVLTQYRPRSLNEHIGIGRPWDLDRERGGVTILQPYLGRSASDWYRGTADAVYQNLSFIQENRCDQVLILAGDHVYKIRYDEMVNFHRARRAECTVGVVEVPLEEGHRFGLVIMDDTDRVVDWEEKPQHPQSTLASMGIYVFDAGVLCDVLVEDARNPRSSHDFGKDILPALLSQERRIFGYRFRGYWRDVGTVESYWKANLEFLEEPQPVNMDTKNDRIRTRSQDRPGAVFGPSARVERGLVCHGSRINGTVVRSVLSQGVVVEEGAVVEDSIIFDDTVIRRGARVHHAIIDKEVEVGQGATVGWGDDLTPNATEPANLNTGITLVGKRAVVPPAVRIGRNCKIGPGARPQDFPPGGEVPSGTTVQGPAPAYQY